MLVASGYPHALGLAAQFCCEDDEVVVLLVGELVAEVVDEVLLDEVLLLGELVVLEVAVLDEVLVEEEGAWVVLVLLGLVVVLVLVPAGAVAPGVKTTST